MTPRNGPPDSVLVMTRDEIANLLRGFVREYRIDPHDAGLIYGNLPADGLDTETLGDQLDGVGYPELATAVYKLAQAEAGA